MAIDRETLRYLGWWLAFGVLMCLLPFVVGTGTLRILIFAHFLAMFAMSWDFLSGRTGYISFGHPFLIGIAGYTTAILSFRFGVPIYYSIPAAIVATMVGGTLFFLPALRIRGTYFALVTLAFMEILYQLTKVVAPKITGGTRGISGLEAIVTGAVNNYYLSFGIMFAIGVVLWLLIRTRLGIALSAIRMNEEAVRSTGHNTTKLKLFAFMVSAAVSGIGGAFYVHYIGSIAPRGMFEINFLFTILVAALLGGAETIIGPIMGAYFLTVLLEYLAAGDARHGALPSLRRDRARALRRQARGHLQHHRRRRAQGAGVAPVTATATGPLLEVRDLHMTFGGIRAVQGISFQVAEGETLGLIGPNGAGKTTVFNMIMAELKPTSGEIWFKGENITRVPTYERVKRGIARTYQVPQPFAEMSVGANIRVGMAPDDIWKLVSEGADHAAEADIGRSVGFSGEQIDMLPSELAMGDLRRLEMARNVAVSPTLLLLDEVFAGLTLREIAQISELLVEKKRKDGLTYIIVSHDLRALAPLVDRVIVMSFGEVIAEGTFDEVVRDEAVRDAYLGQ